MKSNLFDIRDRVVVITGGTGVLGREIGKYLALEGAKVALLGRRKEVGDALITDILSLGGEAVFYSCDVMDMASVESVCEKIMARYGRVDALLNAAGGNMPGATITPTGTLFDVQVEEFQKVLNVNLTGTVIPTQVFLKPMVNAGKGAIVNFSSMAAFRPLTRVMGYAAAKAGISNFTAFLANEVASKFTPGIRVNAIAPGSPPRRQLQPHQRARALRRLPPPRLLPHQPVRRLPHLRTDRPRTHAEPQRLRGRKAPCLCASV